jgi:hypothetical protein
VRGGRVYLTQGYKGAPFGLSVVVPAVAGPFDLGDVVVRAAISVDSQTGAITVTSDPLPQILDGVPLRIQTLNVTVDRSGLIFNPTNCAQQQIGGSVAGAQGAVVALSSPFAATGCKNLPFKPSLTASTRARTSKASGASLTVSVLSRGGPGVVGEEANIRRVDLQFPKQLPARLTTLQKACTEGQFAADPAGCPAASDIGSAIVHTPVLPVALSGPIYLVSHGGAAFPEAVVILQGDGVRLDLHGNTDIKKGITYSRFETVPDAPVSSFVATLPEGPHSVFATDIPVKAKGDMCGLGLLMPTVIEGQNAIAIKQNTKIAVTGCPKTKKKPKHSTRTARRKRS